jgi:hypothetical protein
MNAVNAVNAGNYRERSIQFPALRYVLGVHARLSSKSG